MTFGEQTDKAEAHRILSLAADAGVTFVDTAEIYPIAPRRETAGATSRIVGEWLSGRPRDKVVLATKVAGRSAGLEWIPSLRTDPPGPERPPVLDGPSIVAAAKAELRRLNTDHIDLLYLHWPDRYTAGFGRSRYRQEQEWEYSSFSSIVAAVGSLLEDGCVRYWALSNETSFGVVSVVLSVWFFGGGGLWRLECAERDPGQGGGVRQASPTTQHDVAPAEDSTNSQTHNQNKNNKHNEKQQKQNTNHKQSMYCMVADALGVERPVCIQNSFSLIHRSFEGELAEACSPRHFDLPLLPWSVLAGGALTGKYLGRRPAGVEAAGPGSRFNLFPDRYARFTTARVDRAAARYAEIAADCGLTPAQLAYAWAASRPFVGSTIVGAATAAQLADNLKFTSKSLGDDVLAAIDAVHLARRNPSLVD